MITLDVKAYCHDCRDFEASLEKKAYSVMSENGEIEKTGDTVVYCKYRNRCENIRRYVFGKKTPIRTPEFGDEVDDGK